MYETNHSPSPSPSPSPSLPFPPCALFSGKVGVNSTNGANRLQGVHTWNMAGSSGGTGIRLHSGSGRVEQSYLDYAPLVIACKNTASYAAQLAMVEGNLFRKCHLWRCGGLVRAVVEGIMNVLEY